MASDNRWPATRPPFVAKLPAVAPGDAAPWTGQLHPSLPLETCWLLGVEALPPGHAGAFELTLDLRWRRFGCARLFDLGLTTHPKDGQTPKRFVYSFHPTDRPSLLTLLRVSRQPCWHLVVVSGGEVLRAVEMDNTLDLEALLREVWQQGQA